MLWYVFIPSLPVLEPSPCYPLPVTLFRLSNLLPMLSFAIHEEQRKSLADKQYMWATRMSHPPNMSTMETHFYQQAIVHLDASAATGDRLMDCIRAAFLLSAFQYMNGRHHSVSFLQGGGADYRGTCYVDILPSRS